MSSRTSILHRSAGARPRADRIRDVIPMVVKVLADVRARLKKLGDALDVRTRTTLASRPGRSVAESRYQVGRHRPDNRYGRAVLIGVRRHDEDDARRSDSSG